MKARQLIANAAFGPDALKGLYKAFDDAWEQIAPSISNRPEAVEAARLRLANIILALASNGALDAQTLTDAAVQAMHASPTKP